MHSVEAELSRALDLLSRGESEQAKAAIAELLDRWRKSEDDRAKKLNDMRHDIGNALSIAQASVEAMLDGVVGITDQRLNRIRDILSNVSSSMYELTSSDVLNKPRER